VLEELTERAHRILETRGTLSKRFKNHKRYSFDIEGFQLSRAWCTPESGWTDREPFWKLTIRYQYPDSGLNEMVLDWECPPKPFYSHEHGIKLLMLLRREQLLEDLTNECG
jgi:hypothetical protein